MGGRGRALKEGPDLQRGEALPTVAICCWERSHSKTQGLHVAGAYYFSQVCGLAVALLGIAGAFMRLHSVVGQLALGQLWG